MKRITAISPLMSLIVFAGIALIVMQGNQKARATLIEGPVRYVSDGDTFRLEGHSHPIRLWGIDAPEIGTAQGERAKARLRGLVGNDLLRCHQKAVDRYRRTVAQCFIGEKDISSEMILAGSAVEMCRYSRNAYGTC